MKEMAEIGSACRMLVEVEADCPQAQAGDCAGLTRVKLADRGGMDLAVQVKFRQKRRELTGKISAVTILVPGELESATLIKALEWAADSLRRQLKDQREEGATDT